MTPYNLTLNKPPRYYQSIAINRAVEAILTGRDRLLLTMATGTGKTTTAFQICWKLWTSRWNRKGEHRRPKILFLADRNFLVDGPMTRDFAPLKDAIHKIGDGRYCTGVGRRPRSQVDSVVPRRSQDCVRKIVTILNAVDWNRLVDLIKAGYCYL